MKMGLTIRGLLAVLGLFLSSGVLNAQTDITVRGGPNWPDSKSGNWPEKTVDRDPKTYWAGDPNSDKWELILEMKETIELKNVTVIYFSSAFIPKIAMIYISSDGEKWDEIGLLPSQTPANLAIGRKARYMKLEMKGKSSSGNNQPAICEITFNEEIPKN